MSKKNKRLEEIKREVDKWEKETPYNFCDRWCERCVHEKQIRCKLYLDELEQRLTCIAHGREEDDPEITEQVIKQQYEDLEIDMEEIFEEYGIDLDEIEDQNIKEHVKFTNNNPLSKTAEQYRKMTNRFLEDIFYKNEDTYPEIKYHFETIAWYHTLLPVKLQRALAGFHEPEIDEDISLIDAVAQFEICKKAITKSIKALRKITPHLLKYKQQIGELIAILHNIHSRIEKLEESIE